MATNTETLIKPTKVDKNKRITHRRRAGKIINMAMAATLLGGTGLVAGLIIHEADQIGQQNASSDLLQPNLQLTPELEKSIDKVPIAETTQSKGLMSIVSFGGSITKDKPFAYSLSFQDETIVAIQDNNPDGSIWIELALKGNKVTKEYTGQTFTNYDGTKTKAAIYEGFTAWIKFTRNVIVMQPGADRGYSGLGYLRPFLKVGTTIGANVNINGITPKYAKLNQDSLRLLDENIGKPNSRNQMKFRFQADFAYTDANPNS